MNAFKQKREEAEYRTMHENPQMIRIDNRAYEVRPCGDILRQLPVFSRLFSEARSCGRPCEE